MCRDPSFSHTIGFLLRCASECLQTMTNSNIYIALVQVDSEYSHSEYSPRHPRLPHNLRESTDDHKNHLRNHRVPQLRDKVANRKKTTTHTPATKRKRRDKNSNVTHDFTAPRTVPRPTAHYHTTNRHMSHFTFHSTFLLMFKLFLQVN